MTSTASLADRHAVLSAAMPALEGIGSVLHEAPGTGLGDVVAFYDRIVAEASRARAAAVAEVLRRGDVAGSLPGWIREHAPSLRQGGAHHVARLVTEVTKGGPLWAGGSTGPDPESPLGIVWDAVTEPEETEPIDPEAVADEDASATAAESIWARRGLGGEESAAAHAAEDRPGGGVAACQRPLSPGNALAVLSEMRALKPRLRPEAVPTVTRALVELVREWGPAHMRKLRPRLLAAYGLEGELDDLHDKLKRAAYLSSPDVESGALTEYRMALTPEQAATLEAAIGPLAAPRPNKETGERDLRPTGQRRAEALTEICQGAAATQLETGGEGVTGAHAALHFTMSLADLRRLTGCRAAVPGSRWSVPSGSPFGREFGAASVADHGFGEEGAPGASGIPGMRGMPGVPGFDAEDDRAGLFSGEVLGSRAETTLLSPEALRRLACNAHLIPHVLGSHGEHLDQGREIRLFTKAQRRKLLRRDGHCTYPGCDRPAAWARAHHVLHWFDGGSTDVDNAALLCERHHTHIHNRRLWAEVRSIPDDEGRYVIWDLTPGSYDEELRRRQVERAAQDPPRFSPQQISDALSALHTDDFADRAWAQYVTQDLDDEDQAFELARSA